MTVICVTGIWHQGVVLSACLAELGHEVRVVCDEATATRLTAAQAPVPEPQLEELISRNVAAGRLRYLASVAEGVAGAEFVFLSSDTGMSEDGVPELEPLLSLVDAFAPHLEPDSVFVVTAQVPVGTTEILAAAAKRRSPQWRENFACVPEFLELGRAVESFQRPDRIVIGATAHVAARVDELYRPLGRRIVCTDVRSAEMAKHAANAFLASSVSFINEIADLCESVGADAAAVSEILKLDRRIGEHAYLSPGLGFSGATLQRELMVLQRLGDEHGVATAVVDAVQAVNAARPRLVAARLGAALDGIDGLEGARVGILGLTYKPGTGTMRGAVSLRVIDDLRERGASVAAFDPLANLAELDGPPPFDVADSPYEAATDADALVLLMEWEGSDALDLNRLRAVMRGDLLLDARDRIDRAVAEVAGFRYIGIGRTSEGERQS